MANGSNAMTTKANRLALKRMTELDQAEQEMKRLRASLGPEVLLMIRSGSKDEPSYVVTQLRTSTTTKIQLDTKE